MRLDRLFKIMVNKKKFIVLLGIFLISAISAQAQKQLPILDMHMHARVADHYGPPPLPMCAPVDRMPLWDQSKSFLETLEKFSGCKNPVWSPKTDEEVLRQTVAVMEKYNIVGVLGGKPELVAKWMKAAPGRFIPGLDFRLDRATGTATAVGDGSKFKPMSPDEMRALYKAGGFQVFGEVLNQYAGIAPDDARMEPYWALAEELRVSGRNSHRTGRTGRGLSRKHGLPRPSAKRSDARRSSGQTSETARLHHARRLSDARRSARIYCFRTRRFMSKSACSPMSNRARLFTDF